MFPHGMVIKALARVKTKFRPSDTTVELDVVLKLVKFSDYASSYYNAASNKQKTLRTYSHPPSDANNARTKQSQHVTPGSNDRSYRDERNSGGRMSRFGWWVEQ